MAISKKIRKSISSGIVTLCVAYVYVNVLPGLSGVTVYTKILLAVLGVFAVHSLAWCIDNYFCHSERDSDDII